MNFVKLIGMYLGQEDCRKQEIGYIWESGCGVERNLELENI